MDKCLETITNEYIYTPAHSRLYLIDRQIARWGGYELIQIELNLINKALSTGPYQYLHLISGQCFPIKSQDYIHQFFREHDGLEFIHSVSDSSVWDRCRYYWFFRELPSDGLFPGVMKKVLCRMLLYLQKLIGYNRFRDIGLVSIRYGSEWCSITEDFARYIAANESFIKQHFQYTNCCDEIFKQTLLHLSPFRNNVSSALSNCRLISFEGIHPVIFDYNNEPELKKDQCYLLGNLI